MRLCGQDPLMLRAGDCVSEVDLWPRVDSSDIHEFLVLRTSFITREQLKSRKALEGHKFWDEWPGAGLKKVAADTVIVVTQHISSVYYDRYAQEPRRDEAVTL
ncbi:hypothetical protein HPB50_024316 [Hyalomma asiaticum]|uniref:Uncharacterized protein n=1 Tax=Hyalomma asiaticum TaxID=266040 RepID=A0ACB7T902_HYAAI|nr:hypothetical protein HPB50_024316 [Hyalomma asiaticum]